MLISELSKEKSEDVKGFTPQWIQIFVWSSFDHIVSLTYMFLRNLSYIQLTPSTLPSFRLISVSDITSSFPTLSSQVTIPFSRECCHEPKTVGWRRKYSFSMHQSRGRKRGGCHGLLETFLPLSFCLHYPWNSIIFPGDRRLQHP